MTRRPTVLLADDHTMVTDGLSRILREAGFDVPVVQNVDAEVHDSVQAIRDALVRQLYLPVQWTGCVQALAARGVNRIAECGPGKVLAGLAKRIDKSIDARSIGTPGEFATALDAWELEAGKSA